ncbi:hypothetical protein ACFQJ5_14440 [Halomicroarcula sp. GCM10025324]|uniref:hypothetical protein n=1 Tax=Haloarcula TaxID=2237 RepID=UPI0023E850E7|nr:hypothetical protein [Halomicroarcula sp. ZS-22-S1]
MSSDLHVTDHVDSRRWLQRSDDPVMDPVDAWAHGVRLRGHGLEGDEVRYHEHTRTVLVRKNTSLVTVLNATDLPSQVRYAVRLVREGTDE